MIRLPSDFTEEMQQMLGDDYPAFLQSYEDNVKKGLRLNRKKISPDAWKQIDPFACTPVPWIDNGFFYGADAAPSRHPYYYAGLYYLQEASAMTPANRIPVAPDSKVLDLCSAPGGRATEILSRLSDDGLLVANDISATRAKGLLKNIELFGGTRAIVTSADPDSLAAAFDGYFDRILVDAPCSGEGMFRKNPGMVADWETYGPAYYAQMQRSILPAACAMLKPGGILMYSTCTFSAMEDEENVEWLLREFPELSLMEIQPYEGFMQGLTQETKPCVRIFPHKMPGEGHFMAMFQKDGGKEMAAPAAKPKKRGGDKSLKLLEKSDFFSFMKRCGLTGFCPEDLSVINGYVSYFKDAPALPEKMHILRKGLLLGQVKNNKFVPSQALAMALDPGKYTNVLGLELQDERVLRYLKGETIQAETDSGYALVCVDGFPLGWAKVEGSRLKNKYLPGWRLQPALHDR